MLVLRTSNFQGTTIRPIVPRRKHSIVFIVGHVVPGVVVCLLLCVMVGRVKRGHGNWRKLLWYPRQLDWQS